MNQTDLFFAPAPHYAHMALIKRNGQLQRLRLMGHPKESLYCIFEAKDTYARFVDTLNNRYIVQYFEHSPGETFKLAYETDCGWAACNTDQVVIIKNVVDGHMLDHVCARYDGMHYWYEGLDSRDVVLAIKMKNALLQHLTLEELHNEVDEVLYANDIAVFRIMRAGLALFQKISGIDNETALSNGFSVPSKYVAVKRRLDFDSQYPSLLGKYDFEETVIGIWMHELPGMETLPIESVAK